MNPLENIYNPCRGYIAHRSFNVVGLSITEQIRLRRQREREAEKQIAKEPRRKKSPRNVYFRIRPTLENSKREDKEFLTSFFVFTGNYLLPCFGRVNSIRERLPRLKITVSGKYSINRIFLIRSDPEILLFRMVHMAM
jgi:hypothetical protein